MGCLNYFVYDGHNRLLLFSVVDPLWREVDEVLKMFTDLVVPTFAEQN